MTDLLQPDSLNQLQELLEDEFWPITELFARQLPQDVLTLQQAVAAQDMNAVNRQAHSIKGSCANLGAAALAHQAMLIEKAARVPDPAVIQAALATLPGLVEQTLAALRAGGYLKT